MRKHPRFFDPQLLLTMLLMFFLHVGSSAAQQDYAKSTRGTRVLEGDNGFQIKVLVEAANLGDTGVELSEITFPGRSLPANGHRHPTTEIFYVLSGQLHHVVNGEVFVLDPGMVGIVRPGDEVMHRVPSDEPVKALVIWAPGGEAERLSQFFRQRPIQNDDNR